VARVMSTALKQTIIIDNKAGAGGNIAPRSSPSRSPTATSSAWATSPRWRSTSRCSRN
jgi:tripartite-type tricarboxylate transporter receptor subunit TctC